MIAYNTIYVDGRRPAQQPSSLQQTYESLRQLDDGVAWIDLYEPTQEEFESVGREPELLRQGPQPVLHEIMDQIVDDYEPVLEGLGTDIQEVEVEVFGGNEDVSQRIYELSRELVQFQRATSPLARTLDRVAESDEHDIDPELRSYLRELHDRVLRVVEPTEGFRDMLSDILVVNLTLIGVRQNDQTKKISAWAAILIVPTLITGIYGMNFDFMPELHWTFGYPFALALMVSISVGLYAVFRHVRWL